MNTLGVVLARAGSKGIRDKCVRPILGRPMIDYTFDHALASRLRDCLVLSTDSDPAKQIARSRGIEIIDRPADLADDTATIDAAVRHAVLSWESRHEERVDAICILYANIPVRAAGAIDRAIGLLEQGGGSSVRTVAPIGKHHPDWLHRLDGDRMTQFRRNSIHRRQDLEALYYHDGAVIVVRRAALFDMARVENDAQGFLGSDRRALLQSQSDAADVDELHDLALAEALLTVQTPASIVVGRRRVGPTFPTYVIAEAGVNHNGELEQALRLVDAAVQARADAVKFQVFSADRIVASHAPTAGYQAAAGAGASQRHMLRGLELSDAAFARIREHCARREIEFLATPFSDADLDRLLALGTATVKIASTDINNRPLLERAAASGCSLVLSTGAATEGEIAEAVAWLRGWGASWALLHCVSRYPTPIDELNLRAVVSLRDRFRCVAGLSDHTTSTVTGALAVAAGASLIEKHLTLDRGAHGPDHRTSLDPGQMRAYIQNVRDAQAAMGDGALGRIENQADVRATARKGLVAARPIPAGKSLAPEDLAIKRPAAGIEPSRHASVIGRTTRVAIDPDSPITWEMLS